MDTKLVTMRRRISATPEHISCAGMIRIRSGIVILAFLFLLNAGWVFSAYADAPARVSIAIEGDQAEESRIDIGIPVRRTFRITSAADDCYIRIAPIITTEWGSIQEPICPEETGWLLADDGKWYCTKAIGNGQSCTFSGTFILDGTEPWIANASGVDTIALSEVVYADAVQRDGLQPDWGTQEPWGAIQPDVSEQLVPTESENQNWDNVNEFGKEEDEPSALGTGEALEYSSVDTYAEMEMGDDEYERTIRGLTSLPQTSDSNEWIAYLGFCAFAAMVILLVTKRVQQISCIANASCRPVQKSGLEDVRMSSERREKW